MLHSSDINGIVNAKWHYILSDECHLPRPCIETGDEKRGNISIVAPV